VLLNTLINKITQFYKQSSKTSYTGQWTNKIGEQDFSPTLLNFVYFWVSRKVPEFKMPWHTNWETLFWLRPKLYLQFASVNSPWQTGEHLPGSLQPLLHNLCFRFPTLYCVKFHMHTVLTKSNTYAHGITDKYTTWLFASLLLKMFRFMIFYLPASLPKLVLPPNHLACTCSVRTNHATYR
jgi:hypothetical protein